MSDAPSFSAPKPENWDIMELVQAAKEGRLLLPVFQRSFVWEGSDVRDLFDSIYHGFPVGNLLLWRPPPDSSIGLDAQAQFGPFSFDKAPAGDRLFVVDGQQRITSLVAVLLGAGVRDAGDLTRPRGELDSRFSVVFNLSSGKFELVPPSEKGPADLLPLHVVPDTSTYLEWLQARKPPLSREHVALANQVVKALRDYKIPAYVVTSRDDGPAREVFTRLNEKGRPLRKKDVFAALHRGREGGTDLAVVARELGELGWGRIDEGWLLKALAAVDGKLVLGDRTPGPALRELATRLVDALRQAVLFLRDVGQVPHWALLPYRFPLLPLVRFADRHPGALARPDVSVQLRSWLWRGMASETHGNTSNPAIRAALADAALDDALEAADRLLRTVPERVANVLVRAHNFRTAATKLACIVVLRFGPRHVITGEPLSGYCASQGDWRYIFRRDSLGTENRLFHPMIEGSFAILLREAQPEVAASHAVTEQMQTLLHESTADQFLAERSIRIVESTRQFLQDAGVLFDGQ